MMLKNGFYSRKRETNKSNNFGYDIVKVPWNIQEHRHQQEDAGTNGCCFNHIIGLPRLIIKRLG
jgi:hypothetical protein